MRLRCLCWMIVLAVTGTAPCVAATSLPEPGARVRLTTRAPQRERWIGPFVAVTHDTVRMRRDGPQGTLVTVPALHVERFEVSQGVHSRVWRGTLLGMAIGAALGAVGGYYLMEDSMFGPGAGATAGAVALGLLGAGIGAANAAGESSEQWCRIPLDDLGLPGP